MFLNKILLLLLILLSLFSVRAEAADKYYAPPTRFSAAFQIMDKGLTNLFGLFSNATGSFALATDSISGLRIAIDSKSLMLANGANARELAQLFAVAEYPEITFQATAAHMLKDNAGEIKGTLTVHGVSKPALFTATLNQTGASSEQRMAGLSLRGSFKRADFGMGDPPEMPGRFGDTVTLLLDMQAISP